MSNRLLAIPLYNEEETISKVLEEVYLHYDGKILIVDDGSTDRSVSLLKEYCSEHLVLLAHERNMGYGAALIDAFQYAIENGFESVATMDCDDQHEPRLLGELFSALERADVVSGSRYLQEFHSNGSAPAARREINFEVTRRINELTGYKLSDGFCGFKAYRVEGLQRLQLDEPGYALPLQLWIQAAHFGLTVTEIPVPRIYRDVKRSFGLLLDDPRIRLAHYHKIIDEEFARWKNVHS